MINKHHRSKLAFRKRGGFGLIPFGKENRTFFVKGSLERSVKRTVNSRRVWPECGRSFSAAAFGPGTFQSSQDSRLDFTSAILRLSVEKGVFSYERELSMRLEDWEVTQSRPDDRIAVGSSQMIMLAL